MNFAIRFMGVLAMLALFGCSSDMGMRPTCRDRSPWWRRTAWPVRDTGRRWLPRVQMATVARIRMLRNAIGQPAPAIILPRQNQCTHSRW